MSRNGLKFLKSFPIRSLVPGSSHSSGWPESRSTPPPNFSLECSDCIHRRESLSSFFFALKCVVVCFALAFFVLAGTAHGQAPPCPHTPAADPPTDRDALIALYCAPDDAPVPWYDCTWNLDQPIGGWCGVTVNVDNEVTRLDLNYQDLTGTIPSELGNLRSLEELDLSGNFLIGTIPPELGKLTDLREIIFTDNKLIGTIPPELGNLLRLEEFYLDRNNLSGTIPSELGLN